MGPPSSFVISFILAIIVAWFKITAAETPAITKLESERKALVQSGWWYEYTNSSISPCELSGINCDEFGHVTGIYSPSYSRIGDKFRAMNFSKLPKLDYLGLDDQGLIGTIPSQICELSKLTTLSLFKNDLSGSIHTCLGNLSKLVTLDLSENILNSSIPSQLGSLKSISYLYLYGNKLTGSIPSGIGRLSQLIKLRLSSNHLSSIIPSCLGNLSELVGLDLSDNILNGSIPSQLGSLKSILYMSFDRNELSGPIPPQVGDMRILLHMDISFNKIIGIIPSEIGRLTELRSLDLRNNFLSGSIPDSFYNCFFYSLNLSYNFLSGQIPDSLKSYYHYDPSAFLGNKYLVYTKSPSKRSHKTLHYKEIILFIACCLFLITITLGIWLYCQKRVKPSVAVEKITKSRDIFLVWNYDGRIAYEEIVKATEDFDLKYCIGTGGYGSVYRAELPDGKVFAVKKLHRLEAEEPAFDESFRSEVKLLTEVRHKNIIKLHGFCLHRRCMFLVYEYMERGSLFYALRNDVEALELNWSRRLNIVKDIAHAMSYLHHDCSPSIIHRDLSTNNILLNNEMQAFVSDFGTARFLDPTLTNISIIAGTFGYIAPELAYTVILNEKCDIYSYGVVVMETIMGKHPQEIISKLSTSSIEQVKLQEILDHRLPRPRNGLLTSGILQVVSYALACLSPIPKLRPSMKHISDAFLNKKTVAFENAFCEISLGQLRADYEASS